MANHNPRVFTIEQRAMMSASHRFRRGTSEWWAAYEAFIRAGDGQGEPGRIAKKLEINAAIFASHRAPGLRGSDVWDALFRNYIEREILIDQARRNIFSGAGRTIAELLFCENCDDYMPYTDWHIKAYNDMEVLFGACIQCGNDMMPARAIRGE